MTKLILVWILAANGLFVSHIWRLHESTKWDFCLCQILGVCIGILCWDCTGAYLSQSNGNLVWNINCTKLPVSELITSQNLLLFWNCAISTCRSLHSIVLWFLLPLQIDTFNANRMEAHMNIKHETMTKDLPSWYGTQYSGGMKLKFSNLQLGWQTLFSHHYYIFCRIFKECKHKGSSHDLNIIIPMYDYDHYF